jgi:hypothetical protein
MDEKHQEIERQFLQDVAAYRAELEAKPESELDILIEVEEARVRQEQRHRPFFDQPSADANFAVWIGMPTWTSDQAAALLLGKEPLIVHWARVVEHLPESAFARRYGQLKASLESSKAAGQLNLPGSPNDIVNWARDREIDIPSALNTAVPKLVASDDDVGDTPSGKVAACMEAIQAVYGAFEPEGISQEDRLRAINRWLTQKERSKVSLSTLKRGWREKYGSQSRSGKLLSRSKRS